MSIFIGGGQDYYGPTAERDKQVVQIAAKLLSESSVPIQIVTGGTAGIPDDFAKHYKGNVVDIVSSEYLKEYKRRTQNRPRPYWVAGNTQKERRLALLTNPDIRVGLFIQGGQYTTHELKLFTENRRRVVAFQGSGGASGGIIEYEGWKYLTHKRITRAYDSIDPDEDPYKIAQDLIEDVLYFWLD